MEYVVQEGCDGPAIETTPPAGHLTGATKHGASGWPCFDCVTSDAFTWQVCPWKSYIMLFSSISMTLNLPMSDIFTVTMFALKLLSVFSNMSTLEGGGGGGGHTQVLWNQYLPSIDLKSMGRGTWPTYKVNFSLLALNGTVTFLRKADFSFWTLNVAQLLYITTVLIRDRLGLCVAFGLLLRGCSFSLSTSGRWLRLDGT